MLPSIFGHYPSPVSVKQLEHFIQIIENGRFAPYSYSDNKNLQLYKSRKPPPYNLTKVTVPTYIYYADNDQLCKRHDVMAFAKDLPNNIGSYLIPQKEFNHLDFILGRNARRLLYYHILKVSKEFETIRRRNHLN